MNAADVEEFVVQDEWNQELLCSEWKVLQCLGLDLAADELLLRAKWSSDGGGGSQV